MISMFKSWYRGKIFKYGPSKIGERQPFKTLKRYGLHQRSISLKIFKGCLPQILLGPFLNTLPYMLFESLVKRKRDYHCTKMKFFIKDFFSKCDQIQSFLWIRSHLLKKSLMKNFVFCAVYSESTKKRLRNNPLITLA